MSFSIGCRLDSGVFVAAFIRRVVGRLVMIQVGWMVDPKGFA